MKIFRKMFCVLMLTFIVFSMVACNDSKNTESLNNDTSNVAMKEFPKFNGMDFDGNKVDESIFKGKKGTVVNFWFNGCTACVNEMPALEEFSKVLKNNDSQIIGVNLGANNDNEELKQAKEILKKQKANYRNIFMHNSDEVDEFLSKIIAFPTTIIVDENGKIIGEPIVGDIEDKKIQDNILNIIKNPNITVSKSDNEKNLEVNKLNDELNKIFIDNEKIWDKIFANTSKEDAMNVDSNFEYEKFLEDAFEKTKESLTEEEQNIAKENILKIKELNSKIQDLQRQ